MSEMGAMANPCWNGSDEGGGEGRGMARGQGRDNQSVDRRTDECCLFSSFTKMARYATINDLIETQNLVQIVGILEFS